MKRNQITAKIRQMASNTVNTAYGYGRVSHADSYKGGHGDSLPGQQERITAYYEKELKDKGIRWGGFSHDEKNISAFRVAFKDRPAGKKILSQLKPGDILIFDKVDRIWRSNRDFVYLMEHLRDKGITVHIVSLLGQSFQNNTAMGEFMMKMFVLFAELDSSIKSERTKEGLGVVRSLGRAHGGHCAWAGCKIVPKKMGDRTVSFLQWDEPVRAMMGKIVAMMDVKPTPTWNESIDKIEALFAAHEGRQVRPYDAAYRDKDKFRRYYQYECAYRFLGIKECCQIPPKAILLEAARQHRRQRTLSHRSSWAMKRDSEITPISASELLAM